MISSFFIKISFILLAIVQYPLLAQDVNTVLTTTIKNTLTIKTAKYTMNKRERMNGKLVTGSSQVKLHDTPFKYYNKGISGVEALYVEGQYGNQLYVNPNGFPYTNIKLSPYSSKLMAKSHHPPFHGRFSFLVKNLNYLTGLVNKKEATVSVKAVMVKGIACYQIEYVVNNFTYKNYTSVKDERLIDLTDRLMLNPGKVGELNGFTSFDAVIKKGAVIKLPSHLGNKVLIYVNKATYIPVMQQLYDEVGLYEEYNYDDLIVNPAFAADEFSENFKDYDF